MTRYVMDLSIPADQMLRYYRGGVTGVVGRARTGERVRFPVAWLRRFVCPDGVHGTFELRVDARRRLINLKRLPAGN